MLTWQNKKLVNLGTNSNFELLLFSAFKKSGKSGSTESSLNCWARIPLYSLGSEEISVLSVSLKLLPHSKNSTGHRHHTAHKNTPLQEAQQKPRAQCPEEKVGFPTSLKCDLPFPWVKEETQLPVRGEGGNKDHLTDKPSKTQCITTVTCYRDGPASSVNRSQLNAFDLATQFQVSEGLYIHMCSGTCLWRELETWTKI